MKTEKAYPERRLRGVLEELSTGCKYVCIHLSQPHFNTDIATSKLFDTVKDESEHQFVQSH